MLKVKTIGMLIGAAVLFSGAPLLDGRAQGARHIEIVASKFSFAPNEITVKKGEPVTLTLHSTDVTHGLVIEPLHVRVEEIHKGQSTDVVLSPGTAGTFEGKCGHFCGKGHGSMVFTVHVVE